MTPKKEKCQKKLSCAREEKKSQEEMVSNSREKKEVRINLKKKYNAPNLIREDRGGDT